MKGNPTQSCHLPNGDGAATPGKNKEQHSHLP